MTDTAPTIVLRGVPEGLEARPIYRYRTTDDGDRVAVRTRRGLRKFDRVELTGSLSGRTPPQVLDDRERRFILGAERRAWRSIERRYGHDAWSRCVDLALSGVVQLRCAVTDDLELGGVVDWALTPSWSRQRSELVEARRATRAETRQRALEAADSVDDICPELARALRESPPHVPSLPGLIAVANDLCDGIVSAS